MRQRHKQNRLHNLATTGQLFFHIIIVITIVLCSIRSFKVCHIEFNRILRPEVSSCARAVTTGQQVDAGGVCGTHRAERGRPGVAAPRRGTASCSPRGRGGCSGALATACSWLRKQLVGGVSSSPSSLFWRPSSKRARRGRNAHAQKDIFHWRHRRLRRLPANYGDTAGPRGCRINTQLCNLVHQVLFFFLLLF